MRNRYISALVLLSLPCQAVMATEYPSELDYYQSFPVVSSASRLSQPLSEAPNAMTVIDRKMIVASGFRTITDLFKLVPGMYVSYYKGSQGFVSYHGATDQYARRMQVLIDGRSVYLPPVSTVDWANLPITVDDIERIEVIRGPAAASHGANSTQGVISITTREAGGMDGKNVAFTRGNKGINDVSARFGKRGETFDYRMTLAYTADNGYDSLTTNPNNLSGTALLNNSNDSNQARLLNYRANYHPDGIDSYDMQFGLNHDIQGVGFSDKNTGTNGNPFHNLIANSGFVQFGWKHLLDNASELNLKYYHIQRDQHEAFPVYLGGVYFPGPVVQSMRTGRDAIEVQHTLPLSAANRLVYGASYRTDQISGSSGVPFNNIPYPLNYSSAFRTHDVNLFAHDEWRINHRLLLNAGGMFERDRMGHRNFSPRIALNYHVTPEHTFRAGVSVAYRTPSLVEESPPAVGPGALFLPNAIVRSPGLMPEKMVSREIGYIGEFFDRNMLLDLRLFSDLLSNGIFYDKVNSQAFVNGLSAEYHGFEATAKYSLNERSDLTVNFAHELASSNGPALIAVGYAVQPSAFPAGSRGNDVLAVSIPRNSASLLYSRRLSDDFSFSTSYYYQDSLQPFDRGWIDFQPTQHRMDVRIAQAFQVASGMKGEVALVVQNLFGQGYTEYIASNLFNRRAYATLKLDW